MHIASRFRHRLAVLLTSVAASGGCAVDSATVPDPMPGGTVTVSVVTIGGGPGPAQYQLVIDEKQRLTVGAADTVSVVVGPSTAGGHGARLSGTDPCLLPPGEAGGKSFGFTTGATQASLTLTAGCPFQQIHDRIVFEAYSTSGQGHAIYAVRPDGSGRTTLVEERLFFPGDTLRYPVVSPDGKLIAGDGVLWSGDGFSLLPLDGFGPDWSPDGQALVLSRFATLDLAIVRPDGILLKQLAGDTPGIATDPAWSPDGAQIAFERGGDIYTIDTVGTNLALVIGGPDYEYGPSWSPDGSQIAYVRIVPQGPGTPSPHPVLHVANRNGSGIRPIPTPPSVGMSAPTWSPDGSRLAFGLNDGVWVVNSDGGGLTRLVEARGVPPNPDWVP